MLGGHHNRPARGARKQPLGDRPFHYIPARRQPQTPSGQPCGDVGHKLATRTDDKAQQAEPVADLSGYDAAPLGAVATGLRLAPWRRCADPASRRAYSCLSDVASSSNQWARARMISALAVFEIEGNAALVGGGENLDQLVAGKIGEIVEGLDPLLAERHQHARGQALERRQIVVDPEFAPALLVFTIAPFERGARALLQLAQRFRHRSPSMSARSSTAT